MDAFEEAVRLDPTSSEARINLGLLYLRQRRTDDALRELTQGVELESGAAGARGRLSRKPSDGTSAPGASHAPRQSGR